MTANNLIGKYQMGETSMGNLTDSDLIEMLDSGSWLARGGSVALGCPGTLRKALCQANMFSPDDGSPTAIVKTPNEEFRIPSEQIHRLWNRIRLV
jgi:hypothetical protein